MFPLYGKEGLTGETSLYLNCRLKDSVASSQWVSFRWVKCQAQISPGSMCCWKDKPIILHQVHTWEREDSAQRDQHFLGQCG